MHHHAHKNISQLLKIGTIHRSGLNRLRDGPKTTKKNAQTPPKIGTGSDARIELASSRHVALAAADTQ
jgi:hypothetical protein